MWWIVGKLAGLHSPQQTMIVWFWFGGYLLRIKCALAVVMGHQFFIWNELCESSDHDKLAIMEHGPNKICFEDVCYPKGIETIIALFLRINTARGQWRSRV